ncbi:NADH-quinone oxidoreductase subunit N [Mycobacterium intracellulare]|nr:NADH-quinone oxidoreductase subunit N [Mycobacterium intracellulare]ASQ89098.1 NADH-quinone oxidoreductase subunit N [Mycobacterium intracellulare subsp. chimaera]ETZ36759.1 NADH-Ubiquinone/plastoquinone (complex I), various chains family protein [Mycobacterium intracellulare MIN_052511_1280]MCA2312341.1 NADH-quinone oxidoreductase subunit N [Mycobacterium intracellulare subsp. chimaera]MCA2354723.1 NADH-quinone oxidoreductase subunit N [Mycobacterium intracellulare subsp. chimaera]MCF18158
MRPLLMLPEILIFAGGLAVLIGGSFLPRHKQWWARVAAAVALCAAIAVAVVGMAASDQSAFEGTFAVDTTTALARIAAAVGVLMVLAVAGDEIKGAARESETYALLLFSTTGILVLAGADDLLVLITGYLLASIPLYGLIGLLRSAAAAEAAMKTYLIGALLGITLMLGVTVLYGVTGVTRYEQLAARLADAPAVAVAAGLVAVLAGLMFEAGGVPAHFWVPDAAQGANGTAAIFLTTVPKIGALIALYRVATVLPDTVSWPLLIAVFAVASMTLGNLAAYWQPDPRRLLGWSTVSQVGYLLVPITVAHHSDLALPSLLFYLAAYTLTNSAAFAVSTALPRWRDLNAYRGLAHTRPCLAGALVVALLGLVGTPPTAVFVGKLTTATAAWDGGQAWLAVIVMVNSLISLFYYLRWIIPLFQRPKDTPTGLAHKRWSTNTAICAAGLSLGLGIAAGPFWGLLTAAPLR